VRVADTDSKVVLGRVGRPHGLKGSVAIEGSSLTMDELREIGSFTWRNRAGETRELTLKEVRGTDLRPLLRFRESSSRDLAAELTNGELLIEREQLPDPGPDQVYSFQLIGLAVVTEDGRSLGEIVDVQQGAQSIYVVKGEKELMIPATDAFVKSVDLTERRVTVTLPEGLEELQ